MPPELWEIAGFQRRLVQRLQADGDGSVSGRRERTAAESAHQAKSAGVSVWVLCGRGRRRATHVLMRGRTGCLRRQAGLGAPGVAFGATPWRRDVRYRPCVQRRRARRRNCAASRRPPLPTSRLPCSFHTPPSPSTQVGAQVHPASASLVVRPSALWGW